MSAGSEHTYAADDCIGVRNDHTLQAQAMACVGLTTVATNASLEHAVFCAAQWVVVALAEGPSVIGHHDEQRVLPQAVPLELGHDAADATVDTVIAAGHVGSTEAGQALEYVIENARAACAA